MFRTNYYVLVFALFILNLVAVAQDEDKKEKKVKILPVPTFGYSPETSTYIGAVSLFTLDFYQDGITRKSNAKVEFTYTWNNQIILEAGWDYFFREEKWFTQGRLHFSDYPDRYYGLGANTTEEMETWYESKRIIGEVSLLKSIRSKMFVGPELGYLSYSKIDYDSDLVFEELRDRENLQVGLVYLWDTRNNLLNSTNGHYVRLSGAYSFNSEENNTPLKIDLRYYKTFKSNYVLATRFYHHSNFGTPTFYNYAFLGGDPYVRGYLYGRFRDKSLSTFQVESRNHLFWRLGISLFGGYSYLGETSFESCSCLFKYNYGVGLRFLMDKEDNVNLRIDYAIGQDGQTGFYISFGESF